MPNLTNKQ